jgi:hypothetical protein
VTSRIPGISGALLPERYVATQLLADAWTPGARAAPPGTAERLGSWWNRVAGSCGPVSPIRFLFDELAMPLFAILGFAAHDVTFERSLCQARLTARTGSPVALALTTWAARPSSRWADLARHAHRIGAEWGFVLTPPFLSLVPTRGYATRRSIDVILPRAVEPPAVAHFLAVAHASRFEAARPGQPAAALSRILARAESFQDAVRADLQEGVEVSLRELEPAIGRVLHGAGKDPRPDVGASSFDEALTLVYRILFLLFAESRHLVPTHAPVYRNAYAVGRFCRDAIDCPADGLWEALAATSRLSRLGCDTDDMHIAPFNGALFARESAPTLERRRPAARRGRADARDEALRRTLVALGSRRSRTGLEAINYRDLGVEQLGAVYERVLDLTPTPVSPRTAPSRGSRHSRLRRQTGTFYTPQSLAEFVVRRTLAPLVDGTPADDILRLRVVDPAMGSGAFLVAACRYLAGAYEDALIDEGRVSPEDIDDQDRVRMRRLIAERCIAGVDRNATAVRLARLSLWLTTLAQGRPLGFLDHRLRVGDSLVGAWPDDLRRLSMRTRRSTVTLPLFDMPGFDHAIDAAVRPIQAMLGRSDDTVSDVHEKEVTWRHLTSPAASLHRWRVAAHIWCARWFGDTSSPAPGDSETRALIDAVTRCDRTLHSDHVARRARDASATAVTRGFFHWPLEFPDVFYDTLGRTKAAPGFDAVIGNPPWEMLRREDGDTTARSRSLLRYVRQSGQYPSCVDGHLNLYQAFVDRSLALVRPGGRLGLVLPWSVATDDGAAALRGRLLTDTAIDMLAGLDNAHALFPIHRGLRFAVVSATTGASTRLLRVTSGIRSTDDLDALPARGAPPMRGVSLSPDDLSLAGGPAQRIPDIRRPGDLELLLSLNRRFRRLGSPDGWGVSFGRELNATDARVHVRPSDRSGVAVIEGKHITPFVVDTAAAARIPQTALDRMIDVRRLDSSRLGYRDVSGVGNRLTLIAAVIPPGVVTTHTILCSKAPLEPARQHFLCALFNSFVLNAVVRMLMGSHVTTTLTASLPVPEWRGDRVDQQIVSLAQRLAEGRPPADISGRLQALVAHRFELTRDELEHLLDGSPGVPASEHAATVGWFDRTRRLGSSAPVA